MYKDQNNMLDSYENSFIIPKYFPAWLSGFIEAEGNFILLSDKRRNMQITGRFNIGQNFEHFIIKAIRDYFGGDVKIQVIRACALKKSFQKKGNYSPCSS